MIVGTDLAEQVGETVFSARLIASHHATVSRRLEELFVRRTFGLDCFVVIPICVNVNKVRWAEVL